MDGKKILRINEAAQYLGVNESTLRTAAKNNEIPFRKFSNKYYFSLTALEIWAGGLDVKTEFAKALAIQLQNA
ncbi:MAG: helix-turn-helix domain-containing protein [Clostridia bacterium]|nr:helix-turn-helix domain-containing protein [Clostridia bacterium]